MVSFGDPVFFVKKKSQQKSSVLVKKKNIKPKLGNLKPFCIILKTSMFLEFFMKTWCFCGKIITSQTHLFLGSCSQLAWYSFAAPQQEGVSKGCKGVCLELKTHPSDFMVAASQPFCLCISEEKYEVSDILVWTSHGTGSWCKRKWTLNAQCKRIIASWNGLGWKVS